tara:strand:- start:5709 stop:7532 length:1824 start_codon:yes stop_codon:yes gene_type:complete
MCGIAGFIVKEKKENLISDFVNEISHRGPDDQSYLINSLSNQKLHIGSSRLSIRGDATENMPMKSASGDIFVYNGEVFDLMSIRNILKNNKKYKGDTRMVFDLLRESVENISKINGMFAFAYFDNKEKRLYLGRDKLGIKPLFYSITNSGDFYFSSEIRSLIKYLPSNSYISQKSVEELFLFNGIHQDSEIIEGVYAVKPGELISVDLNNRNKKTSQIYDTREKFDHVDEDFEELMINVVRDHLSADTSVDLFLSGGIDSSLLAYIIKSKLNKKIRHFSLSFENKSFDEKNNILNISNSLSLESKIFTFNENSIDNYISEAVSNMNSPVLDYSFVPTYLLSKKTSRYTKAVLSGDGADELFGGYEWYRGFLFYSKSPYQLKILISKIVNKLNLINRKNNYLSFSSKVNYFFKYITNNPYAQILIWQSSYQNFDEKKIEIISKELSKYIDSKLSVLDNLRQIDINNFLYTNVLPKVDIASMANSLEVRPPYLDDRIISFALSNKNSNQISFLNTKLFLRRYIDNTNLKFLNKSKKQGFGFPLLLWFRDYGVDKIKQLYTDGNLIYTSNQEPHIKDIIFKNELNPNDLRELWSYYVLSMWCFDNKVNLK